MINKEQQEILKKFENLLPWEKGDILTHIVNHEMTEDEIEKYFIEGSGYTRWDDIDFVKEVIDNHQEEEVLDSMDDWEIVDYLFGNFSSSSALNLKDAMEKMLPEDVAEALERLNTEYLKEIIESFCNKYPDTFSDLIKFCIDKLAKKDE